MSTSLLLPMKMSDPHPLWTSCLCTCMPSTSANAQTQL
jgi:hypothetical protein